MRVDNKAIPGHEAPVISSTAAPVIVGIAIGTAGFVLAVLLAAYIYVKNRNDRNKLFLGSDEVLLPRTRPVIGCKTAAGPGGLKNSPSPLQSPENPQAHAGPLGLQTHHIQPGSEGGPPGTTMLDMEYPGDCSVSDSAYGTMEATPAESTKNQGTLGFNLRYNFEKNALMVTIVNAKDLPVGGNIKMTSSATEEDMGTPGDGLTLDPYVKLHLLPEKQHKVKTRVVRNTQNPVYDEEFTFYGINYNQLQTTTLHFAIIGFDRYSRDEILGEVLCPLKDVDLSDSDKEASLNMELMTRTLKFQNSHTRGDILVSLCYQSSTSKLTAVILKARNLPKFDVTGLADPYVKIYLLYNGQRVAKKKSHVKKRTLNPVYNESFVFELPCKDPAGLSKVSLEFFVMDWDRLTKNEVMGRVDVGEGAKSGSGRKHWSAIMKSPRKQIAEWHRLRP